MTRLNNRAAILGMAALSALGIAQNIFADTNTVLVQTGITTDPGPGGGTINGINDRPAINSSGQVAILGGVAGSSDGTNASILRAEASGVLTSILRNGQAAPGSGGGTFSSFSYPTINSSGQVMGLDYFTGSTDASTFGFFRGDGTSPIALIRQKSSAPGIGGGSLESPTGWNFADTGAVTAVISVTGAPTSQSGIFQGDGTSPTAIVRQGDAAPGVGGGTFSFVSYPAANNLGQVAFIANLNGSTTGPQGIFRMAGSLGEIVRNNTQAPGGGTFSSFGQIPMLNNAGQVAFYAGLSGAPDGAQSGLFRANGTTSPVAIARQNQAAPGGGTFASTIGQNDWLQNASGQVLFQSGINSSPDGSTYGIFRGNGSSLDAIARVGQAVPGGGTLTSFGPEMGFTSGGAGLFTGFVGNLPAGNTDNQGLYLSDGRDMIQVVRKGQSLGGGTVSSFGINFYTYAVGFNALNDAGQVAYQAFLADGSNTVVRFTPTLHWRNNFSGNWDTGDNWTLGINPTQVHDVQIDPQFGTNVNGPVANTTVNTLYVGGKESTATLSLNGGGTLTANGGTTIKSTGQITVGSGRLNAGTVTNDGYLNVSVGGSLNAAAVTNNNQLFLSGPTTLGTTNNFGDMTVSHTTLGTGPLTNYVHLNLDLATVTGSNLINEVGASMTARGSISNSFTNRGNLDVNGLLTTNLTNSGLVTINAGDNLAGNISSNTGIITLSGGGISAIITNSSSGILQGGGGISGGVNNGSNGLIFANSLVYPLVLSNFASNNAGGRIRIANGSTLNVGSSFSNSGLMTLLGNDANFNLSGNLTLNQNSGGTISGAGTIGGSVNNSGTLRAEGGTLLITGTSSTNSSNGLIQISDGATLLLQGGMTGNSGTINVTNGSFINNTVSTFTNNGKISGYGTFTAANWSNGGTMTFTGGFTTINGTVTNQSTRKIEVANNPALFTGNVSNFGTFKNTHTTITFGGTYTEGGTFISDPADNFFSDVNITAGGAWVGGVGDRFILTGDLVGRALLPDAWQTNQAELRFIGGTKHILSVMGSDRGISFDGYDNNFAWGTLALGAGDSLQLSGDAAADGALYVHKLLLSGGINQIASIGGNGLNIYYDLRDPANSYLSGATYSLAGGGNLSPVPEPATIGLLLGPILLLASRRRQRLIRA